MNRNAQLLRRVATANPVPDPYLDVEPEDVLAGILATQPPANRRKASRRRSTLRVAAITAVALLVVLVPAIALATHFGLLGFSNEGQPIDRSQMDPGELSALGESGFTGTVRRLGERAGVAFYVARGRSGGLCFATGSASQAAPKLNYFMGCQRSAPDAFPSPKQPILDLSPLKTPNPREVVYVRRQIGFAADGVARVAVVDADGTTVHSTPVEDNIYATDWFARDIPATAIEALDGEGHVLYRQPLLLMSASSQRSP